MLGYFDHPKIDFYNFSYILTIPQDFELLLKSPLQNQPNFYFPALLYHKNNFICYLDDNNLEMYKYLLQEKNFSYSNDKNSINFYSNKMKINLKDNIDINFSLKAKVLALDSEYNLRNNDDFKKLESTFNTNLEENLYKFITFLQEKKTDILGINYKHYLMTRNDDENYFSKTKIKVKVNIGINKPGLTVRGVTNE